MAGILNKKERIMDVIVTREGRRQMADGNLRATFASFTDSMAFYEKDAVSGSTDPTDRVYFESYSTEADQIIYEKDDSGRLIGEINQPDLTIFGDQIFKKNSQGDYLEITGSVFASEIEGILTASIYNFRSQQILGSEKGNIFNTKQFDLTRNKVYFEINNFFPFSGNPNDSIIDLQSATPLFFDRRLANLPQFKYLPPIRTDGVEVANFINVKTENRFLLRHVIKDGSKKSEFLSDIAIPDHDSSDTSTNASTNKFLNSDADIGLIDAISAGMQSGISSEIKADPIQRETIKFLDTSENNRLFCQMFEVNSNGTSKKLVKLDVLDMGDFIISPKQNAKMNLVNRDFSDHPKKSFFYVGKVFEDSFGVPSFLRLFTLMFD